MISSLVSSALLPPAAVSALHDDARELRLVVRAVVSSILRERPDHADVEDGTNETLRRALESAAPKGTPTRPWVIGIARHVALDLLRARQRQRARDGVVEPPPSSTGALVERLADPGARADETIERAQRDARVRWVMKSLPEGPRRALEMFHVEGLPYQEIARRMEVPLGTVATWVTRGRKAMAEALEEEVRR
jgi:RNA polymerase sigma-70 factor (ECF subfamily)